MTSLHCPVKQAVAAGCAEPSALCPDPRFFNRLWAVSDEPDGGNLSLSANLAMAPWLNHKEAKAMDDLKDDHAASDSIGNVLPKGPDKPAEQPRRDTDIGGLKEVRPEDETRNGAG